MGGCLGKGGGDISALNASSNIIREISLGESPELFLKEAILLNEKEKKGFFYVFSAIRDPKKFYMSKECHVKSRFCLGFNYHIDNEKDVSYMLVGFVIEEKELKISNYAIFLPGTF